MPLTVPVELVPVDPAPAPDIEPAAPTPDAGPLCVPPMLSEVDARDVGPVIEELLVEPDDREPRRLREDRVPLVAVPVPAPALPDMVVSPPLAEPVLPMVEPLPVVPVDDWPVPLIVPPVWPDPIVVPVPVELPPVEPVCAAAIAGTASAPSAKVMKIRIECLPIDATPTGA